MSLEDDYLRILPTLAERFERGETRLAFEKFVEITGIPQPQASSLWTLLEDRGIVETIHVTSGPYYGDRSHICSRVLDYYKEATAPSDRVSDLNMLARRHPVLSIIVVCGVTAGIIMTLLNSAFELFRNLSSLSN